MRTPSMNSSPKSKSSSPKPSHGRTAGSSLDSSWDLPPSNGVNPSRGLLVYVDGSYTNKGPGGWSWVAVDGFEGMQYDSGFVPPPTTNNRMEMWAQIQALSSLHAS